MFVSIYNLFTNPSKSEDKKDFGVFMTELQDPAKRESIEKITIQPKPNNTAKYIVQYKGQPRKTVTQGEYFGETTASFRALGFKNYTVEPKEESTFWQS